MSTLLETHPAREADTSQHRPWSHYCWLLVAFLVSAAWVVFIIRGSDSFGTYRSSGAAAEMGINPYAVLRGTGQTHVLFGGKAQIIDNINLNPPCVLPLFQLLSHLSYGHFA